MNWIISRLRKFFAGKEIIYQQSVESSDPIDDLVADVRFLQRARAHHVFGMSKR